MGKLLVLDAGHGGSDPGATAIDGKPEKHFTLALSLAVRDNLTATYDCQVIMTRESDVDVDLGERAQIANRAKADMLLSVHHDNAGNPAARGGSFYIHTNKRNPQDPTKLAWLPAVASDGTVNHEAPNSYRLASVMVPIIRTELERYAIPWRSMGDPAGIMCADFWVLDQCWGSSALLECYFGSNEHDNWAARQPWFIRDLGLAIAQSVATALELPPRVVAPSEQAAASVASGTPILGRPLATVEQAQAWARARGAHERFIDLAPLYWQYGLETGIRPDALYAQNFKETAGGRYSGQVDPSQNNMAGIKTAASNGDKPEDHETFATPEAGVIAHFQHMGAYVGVGPLYPVHDRYRVVMAQPWAGSIRTVEELGARWAPNPDYGVSIVRDYLNPMIATVTAQAGPSELDKLAAAGLINGAHDPKELVTWEEFASVINRLIERG